MDSIKWARLIATQIVLNRYFGEYDPAGGKAGCSPALSSDSAHSRCAVRFYVCGQMHRAVHIKHSSPRGVFGSSLGIDCDDWIIYDTAGYTLRSPIAKIRAFLVEGFINHMIPTIIDVIADSTQNREIEHA
ncbi:MAG: hypothetical protein ACTID3_08510 [Halomonas sp.]|uniref:hypothetical protein n=1 Tax=Halomonas sp. TaxID=1486246 RepID=UPI003F8E0799